MKDNQQPLDTVRNMQQLNGTYRDSETQPANIGDSERHAATLWDQRHSKRQAET